MNSNTVRGESLVQYTTWNCRGLNGAVKRGNVLAHLKSLGTDVAFLQETHLKNQDHNRLRRGWVGQIFHSHFNFKSRGTAILISKNIPFVSTKVIQDLHGRYVIVAGKLYNIPIVLANIYAPNHDDERFISSFLSTLPNLDTHQLIIGGDLNLVLNSSLDRSSNRPYTLTKSAKMINTFIDTLKLTDPWRYLNPTCRKYSFFSSVHHTYTRIDYFLIDSKFLPSIKRCEYEAMVISDHSPLVLKLAFKNRHMTRTWRFDNTLLTKKTFVDDIKSQIQFYLSTNDTPDVSKSTLWEALKAYIRGQIISQQALISRLRNDYRKALTDRILEIDSQYAESPSPELYREKVSAQAKFNLLTTTETTNLITRSRHRYYEHGDKAGKILALQIKESAASRLIPEIRTNSGQKTIDQQVINDVFKQFYSALYTSESQGDSELIDIFFDNLTVPSISQEFHDQLERAITIEEIQEAISKMQCSKAPGPDGYTSEFFKAFTELISPLLLDVFNESLESGHLPPTLYQACISVLLKKDKDPLNPGSYRPLSLLNVDVKILAKILATRLEKVLPTVVHSDQTGFIKNRHLFFNLRRLFNIAYSPSRGPQNTEILLSLDAEKAFDRVEWDYLFLALSKFGFGPTFISWVKLLYASPLASVYTNGYRSEYFPLGRSTRQGCPLSPLLFALSIEPLAISLRASDTYTGVFRGEREHKVSLYADDLLLYISNPSTSIPSIMSTLESFGKVSGYKVNVSKSILFPINIQDDPQVLDSQPFEVTTSFRYLGITVTKTLNDLFKQNHTKLFNRTEQDFAKWSNLPISLAGRINIIKMTVLPKYLFLFQCIPIFINNSFFNNLDKIITKFIWDKKHPRIRKDFLQRPKSEGGMGLPNFKLYYWACNLRALSYWLQDQLPTWTFIEGRCSLPTSLPALIFSPLATKYNGLPKDTIVSHSLKIWLSIRKHFGWHPGLVRAPLVANHAFPPSRSDALYQIWHNRGIHSFKDLYIDGVFPTFEQLRNKFNLPQTHFFRFLQIRNFLTQTTSTFPNIPPGSPMESIFLADPSIKGGISTIYDSLSYLDNNASLVHLKTAWENDLGIQITDEQWTASQKIVHSSSVCARHGLLQFKVLHRLHLSKEKLNRMYPNVNPACDRCGQSPATLAHMFWHCTKLTPYWQGIFKTFSDIVGRPLDPDPLTAVLGVRGPNVKLTNVQNNMVTFVTLLARRLICLNWKQVQAPTYTALMKDVMHYLQLEKIKFELRGSEDKFYKTWQPFIDHFNKSVLTPPT